MPPPDGLGTGWVKRNAVSNTNISSEIEMKKSIGLILVSFMFSSTSLSQTPIKWGMNLGYTSSNQNFNNTYSNTSVEYNAKPGIEIGVFGEFFSFSHLSFIGEIEYLQKGTKNNDITVVRIANNPQGYEELGKLNFRYDYISFSTLAKGKYKIGLITPFIVAGPTFSYLFDGNEQANISIDKYNKFVLGYSVGIGAEVDTILPLPIFLEIIYNQDITKAFSDDLFYVKNNYLGFLIGIKF